MPIHFRFSGKSSTGTISKQLIAILNFPHAKWFPWIDYCTLLGFHPISLRLWSNISHGDNTPLVDSSPPPWQPFFHLTNCMFSLSAFLSCFYFPTSWTLGKFFGLQKLTFNKCAVVCTSACCYMALNARFLRYEHNIFLALWEIHIRLGLYIPRLDDLQGLKQLFWCDVILCRNIS